MTERLAALAAAARDDEELREALQAATSAEHVVALARGKGIALTDADLAELAGVDVSDAEMEELAGGITGFTADVVRCDTIPQKGCAPIWTASYAGC